MKPNLKPHVLALFFCTLTLSSAQASANLDFTNEVETMQREIEVEKRKIEKLVENGVFDVNKIEALTFGTRSKRVSMDIPYVKCHKTYKRISFDLPKIEIGSTRVIGIKIHGIPKIYKKRVDLSWHYPKCSKAKERISFDIPEFFDAKSEAKKSAKRLEKASKKHMKNIVSIKSKHIGEIRKKVVNKFSNEVKKVSSMFDEKIKEQEAIINSNKSPKEKKAAGYLKEYLVIEKEISIEKVERAKKSSIDSLDKSIS